MSAEEGGKKGMEEAIPKYRDEPKILNKQATIVKIREVGKGQGARTSSRSTEEGGARP